VNRLPFNFLEQDVRRIRRVIEPYFLGTLHMTLSVERVHPDFRNLFDHIRRPLKKDFNPQHAARCIRYLHLDAKKVERPRGTKKKTAEMTLEEILLEYYEAAAEKDKALHGKVSRADHVRKLAELFLELRDEPLRDILAVDPESKNRWEENLRRNNLTWSDVAIPSSVAAKVVQPLFRKYWKVGWSLERAFRRHL
jgi:hypothetical protein